MFKKHKVHLRKIFLVLMTMMISTIPLMAFADPGAPFTSYVILGGKDFVQLKLDSEHPYLYDTTDGHHEVSSSLKTEKEWTAWYDVTNGTLHLKNFHTTDYTIVDNVYTMLCVEKGKALKIDMHGENTMRFMQNFTPNKNMYAIWCASGSTAGDLTFMSSEGDGSLIVDQSATDAAYKNGRPIVIQWVGSHVIMESGKVSLYENGMESSSASDFYVIHAGTSVDIVGGTFYAEMKNTIKRTYSGVIDSVVGKGIFSGGHITVTKNSNVGWLTTITDWENEQYVWTTDEALMGQYESFQPMPLGGNITNFLEVISYIKVIYNVQGRDSVEKKVYFGQDLPDLTPDEIPQKPGYVFAGFEDEDGKLWHDESGIGKNMKTTKLSVNLSPIWNPEPTPTPSPTPTPAPSPTVTQLPTNTPSPTPTATPIKPVVPPDTSDSFSVTGILLVLALALAGFVIIIRRQA